MNEEERREWRRKHEAELETHRPHERLFYCDICEREFKSRTYPWKCPTCETKCSTVFEVVNENGHEILMAPNGRRWLTEKGDWEDLVRRD